MKWDHAERERVKWDHAQWERVKWEYAERERVKRGAKFSFFVRVLSSTTLT